MKSVGIQYLEALRKLKDSGKQFERDIHLSFVPGGHSTYCLSLMLKKLFRVQTFDLHSTVLRV